MSRSVEDCAKQIKEIREAGRYYATASGILQGVYFAAISFTELKQVLQPFESWPFFVPLVFWIGTLVISLIVMRPDPLPSRWQPQDERLKRRLGARRSLLKASEVVFFIGLVWMAGAVVYYLFCMNLPPPEPLTIVITPCP